jgi:hypothetical protein
VGFNAVGIHFGAARQSIEKGDYLGWEVQAKMLKEKGLAVSREIQCTIHKATGEKPTSCGCSWFGHHDVRLILFNHSTCEADPSCARASLWKCPTDMAWKDGWMLIQSTFDQSWARAGQGEAFSQFL